MSTRAPRAVPYWRGRCVDCGAPRRNFYGHRCMQCHWDMEASVDEMAVERLISGDPPLSATRGERQAAIEILTSRGLTASDIARRVRVCTRTVERLRARSEMVT